MMFAYGYSLLYFMATMASGPSLPIIEKQQGLWDEQQSALRSIVTIKQ